MGNKRWTINECNELKIIYDKFTNKELAKIFNRGEGAIEYKKNQLGLTVNVNTKDRGDQHFFDVIDTEDKAYWLGFIYADGYIVKSTRNYELGIELNYQDSGHLNKFNKIFNDYYNVSKKISNYDSIDICGGRDPRGKVRESCIIRIYSKTICEGLVKNGVVQNKTNSEIFPKIQNKELFLHFLRGYIDGDGSYVVRNNKYKTPIISIQGNNIHMHNYIINKLDEFFGIKAYVRPDRTSYKLSIRRKTDIFKLINLMYDNANIYLDRKFDKIIEIKNMAV